MKRKLSTPTISGLPETKLARVDLGALCRMHPRLPVDMAAVMTGRASLGLQQQRHRPGVTLRIVIDKQPRDAELDWTPTDAGEASQHDDNRITEDGAEAIALAVAFEEKSWRVFRRLQREEHGDWLLEHDDGGRASHVVLEVSGVARGRITTRLSEKLDQVSRNTDYKLRCAAVIGFEQPETALQTVERSVS